jgi:AraC family transcriptional regulator
MPPRVGRMMIPRAIPSLNAHQYLKATMTADSWQAGWRSLLLRAYVDPPVVEELTTPPTADQLIVLVTGGSTDIEGRYGGRWSRAHYQIGSLSMTAPGEEINLRWRGETSHSTLQLHLPATTIDATAYELSNREGRLRQMPNQLFTEDPLIGQVMVGLADAMAANAADLYAEAAADLIAAHLLVRHCNYRAPRLPPRDELRLCRVDALMRDNLGTSLSLDAMAEEARMSRFHFLRTFKQTYGETPFKRLTRLRMEEAQRRLTRSCDSITEIAFSCGYENPGHFASAFRRTFGMTPNTYRRATR